MIKPIAPIQAKMSLPRKQNCMMRIDREKHTVVCEDGNEYTMPAKEAWAFLEEIKTGKIYDECC